MKKISKVLLSSGMAACMMAGLFASPTNTATKGLFATEGDQYMDVLGFSNVDFEKLFVNVNVSESDLNAGTAFNAFGLYFGAAYDGNIFGGKSNDFVATSTTQTEGTNLNAKDSKSVETKITEGKASSWNASNKFSILAGIGNMGIKATFDTSGTKTYDNGATAANTTVLSTEETTGDVSYKETGDVNTDKGNVTRKANKTNTIVYKPAVEFGMPIAIGDNELALKAGLEVDINNNTSSNNTKTYTWYNNKTGELVSESTTDIEDESYIRIIPNVSVGIFDAGFEYEGKFDVRTNSVKAADGSKIKSKGHSNGSNTVNYVTEEDGSKTTVNKTDFSYKTKNANQNHKVTLTYGKSAELNEKLTVAFNTKAVVNMNFKKESDNAKSIVTVKTIDYTDAVASATSGNYVTKVTTTKTTPSNELTSTSTVTVSPTLNLAAQYALKPTVTLNLGYRATCDAYKFQSEKVTKELASAKETTVTVTEYKDGKTETNTVPSVNTDTKKEHNNVMNTFTNIASSASAGVTFQMTDNMLLDCSFGASAVKSNGIANITTMFNGMTIAATVKF
ncbi:MAG: hypothetical protein MJ185_03350 [Treponema sp.]|nr:hypothetical protein [Treponema sp.]